MKKHYLVSLAFVALLASCETQDNQNEVLTEQENAVELKMLKVDIDGFSIKNSTLSSKNQTDLKSTIAQLNEQLVSYGVQFEKMEYYTADGAGQTVFFSDRGNKRLDSDFVPNDPRNLVPGTSVPYIVDGTQLITASGLNTLDPILTVMNTWGEVSCSRGLDLPNLGVLDFDLGYVSNVFGFGGTEGFFPGIIVQAGVLESAFFDAIAPDGGSFILGVTFTLTYIEDINADGVGDVAIKEIYYNDAFDWQDRVATGTGVDFETVALHETGHALSQAHFGKVSRTDSNGKVHFSPRAVMNAGYSGVNRVIAKTDKAGHCGNWGKWPNK